MAMEVRRRGVKRQAKDRKTNEAAAAREERKEKAKQEARRIEWTVESWQDGQLVKTITEIEIREGPEDDGADMDDDFDDDGRVGTHRTNIM
jgi:ribosomal protein S6E (S10)